MQRKSRETGAVVPGRRPHDEAGAADLQHHVTRCANVHARSPNASAIATLITNDTNASATTAPRTGSFTGSSQFVTHVVETHAHHSAQIMITPSSAPSGVWFSYRYADSCVSAKTNTRSKNSST